MLRSPSRTRIAIHSVMLPTGKVLYWGFPGRAAECRQRDPLGPVEGIRARRRSPTCRRRSSTRMAPARSRGASRRSTARVSRSCPMARSWSPEATWCCPGVSDPAYPDWAGLNRAFTFNPWTERWTEQPQMNNGRWYPTQVELADGRTITLGGYGSEAPGKKLNLDLEVFKPGWAPGSVGSFSLHPEVTVPTGLLYPHLFTLPDERVAVAGPLPRDAGLIDASDPDDPVTWTDLPRSIEQRNGGNAVLDPAGPRGSWKVTMLGGIARHGPARRLTAAVCDHRDDRPQARRRGLEAGQSAEPRPLLPEHRAASRPVDGHGRRRLWIEPRGRHLQGRQQRRPSPGRAV